MELHYEILINAPKQRVWETMIDSATYNDWAKAFSDGSSFEGEWGEGNTMLFFDAKQGGTKAVLKTFKPYDHMLAEHVAMVDPNKAPLDNEAVQNWLGTTEEYVFEETENGGTKLMINMKTHEQFKEMFDGTWPKALELLKEICEKE